MRFVVINREDVVGPFMESVTQTDGAFRNGRGIGLVEVVTPDATPEMLAGVWYEGFNGANLNMHVAAVPGRRWMTRNFLFYAFAYPFCECGVRRVTGLVAEDNLAARRFDEHLGFTLEARLKDAAPNGDLLIYRMMRDECRWIRPLTRKGGASWAKDRQEKAAVQCPPRNFSTERPADTVSSARP